MRGRELLNFPYGQVRHYGSPWTLAGFFRHAWRWTAESFKHWEHNLSPNPFAEFLSQNPTLAVWSMRTSLREKFLNILSVFLGSSGFLSQKRGIIFDIKDEPAAKTRLGLVDYIPGFLILKLIRVSLGKLMRLTFDIPSHRIVATIFAVVFAIICMLVMTPLILLPPLLAGICAALCFPIAYIAHRHYADKAQELKSALAENDNLNLKLFFNNDPAQRPEFDCEIYHCKTELHEVVNAENIYDESYTAFTYAYLESKNKVSGKYTCTDYSKLPNAFNAYEVVAERFVRINNQCVKVIFLADEDKEEKEVCKCLLFSDTPTGRAAFKAFMQLNIADYQKFKKERPLLDGEETDSKIKASASSVPVNQLARLAEVLGVLKQGHTQTQGPLPPFQDPFPRDVSALIAKTVIVEEAAAAVELTEKEVVEVATRCGFGYK